LDPPSFSRERERERERQGDAVVLETSVPHCLSVCRLDGEGAHSDLVAVVALKKKKSSRTVVARRRRKARRKKNAEEKGARFFGVVRARCGAGSTHRDAKCEKKECEERCGA